MTGFAVPRQLLPADGVAVRLSSTRDWFSRHRRQLERKGFPKPVLPGRWDPKAIDLWLDSQMPAALRPDTPAHKKAWADKLSARLSSVHTNPAHAEPVEAS